MTPVEALSTGQTSDLIGAQNGLGHGEMSLIGMLDRAHSWVMAGDSQAAFSILGPELTSMLASIEDAEERRYLTKVARAHRIFDVLMQDPYSKRAREKPRGYAGDAVMLDFVYAGTPPDDTTSIGKTVYFGTARGPMGLSVAYRKSLLAAYIEQTLATNRAVRILSVASGHLREVETISPICNSVNSPEIVAVDQDRESCRTARLIHSSRNVRIINDSIRILLSKTRASLGQFQLVYSAGLFDYLDDALAKHLVSALAERLLPGGKLLIANFLPDCYGRAFLEIFLDWKLHYRTLGEIEALGGDLSWLAANRFRDPHGNVGYVEWIRPA